MSAGHWPIGLAHLASALDRDLQAAARRAGGPARLWAGDRDQLARWLRPSPDDAASLVALRRELRPAGALEDFRAGGIEFIGRPEPDYPRRLTTLYDPPFGIFVVGDRSRTLRAMAAAPVIALVGARAATSAGRQFARRLAGELADRGALVVSGLAHGIDGAAHEGALEAGGLTVAVVGNGPDVVYPARHRALREQIIGEGAVVSEYWPGTRPARWRFPARNRIIAGLADAVVVIEAGARSGALITADLALDAGRGVLAVPGAPWVETAAGCNQLLRAGAALCESAADIVAECSDLDWRAVERRPAPAVSPLAATVRATLEREPATADDLAAALVQPAGAILAAITELELAGQAVAGDDRRWWAARR